MLKQANVKIFDVRFNRTIIAPLEIGKWVVLSTGDVIELGQNEERGAVFPQLDPTKMDIPFPHEN
jgi:hypothetical protein